MKSVYLLFVMIVGMALTAYGQDQSGFISLHDRDSDLRDFSEEFDTADDIRYTITRRNVEGPYYDGLLGYNVITVRKEKLLTKRKPDEILTILVKGQYLLFGYIPSSTRIFAYSLIQSGAPYVIKNIVVFDKDSSTGRSIGPNGRYKYGSNTPDGRFCILVDSDITVVDLSTAKSRRLKLKRPLGEDASDPGIGGYVGHSVNLTGRYMDMLWTTHRSGRLVVRNVSGLVKRQIKVTIP